MVPRANMGMQPRTSLSKVPGIAGTAGRPSGMMEAKKPDMFSMLKHALDSEGDVVLLTDTDGRIQWASKSFYTRFLPGVTNVSGGDRITILETQSRSFKDPRLFRDNLSAMLARPFEKGEAEWELADGHTIIHMRAYPVRDDAGKLLGRVETYHEEEPKAIACWAEQDIINSAPTGIIAVDDRLHVIFYNRAGAEFINLRLGFTPAELKSIDAVGSGHPVTKAVIDSLSAAKTIRLTDYRPAADTDVYYDLIVTPLAVHRRINGAIISLINSTERHKEFDRVEGARKFDDFFINLMSHDIRNFNQISMGYLEMLELSENLSEEERSYLVKSQSGVAGSNRLIENVQKVRRILESGNLNIVPTDLTKLLQQDLSEVIKAHSSQSVYINTHLKPGSMVMANQFAHDIFHHILENAIKYDPHPEKTIDVDVSESRYEGNDYWSIRIADRGRGIPEDRRQVIFQRIGQTTKGSGIGLSMVNMIVNRIGGHIWVEDRVPGDMSQGSVFVVLLRKA